MRMMIPAAILVLCAGHSYAVPVELRTIQALYEQGKGLTEAELSGRWRTHPGAVTADQELGEMTSIWEFGRLEFPPFGRTLAVRTDGEAHLLFIQARFVETRVPREAGGEAERAQCRLVSGSQGAMICAFIDGAGAPAYKVLTKARAKARVPKAPAPGFSDLPREVWVGPRDGGAL